MKRLSPSKKRWSPIGISMRTFNWDDLRVFLAIARHGTLRRAGEACGLSPATLSRRLEKLERDLGERLVDRLPSGCLLTPFGDHVLGSAERIDDLSLEIGGAAEASAGPRGVVRINADEWLSYLLMKRLGDLRRRYPDLALEVLTSQTPLSLARREADIVLRTHRPDEKDVHVRRVGRLRFGLFGARDYVEAHRAEISARDWSSLAFVGLDEAHAHMATERWIRSLPGAPTPSLRCSYGLGVYDGIVGGAGLGVLAHLAADAASNLACVVPAIAELDQDIWLVRHSAMRHSARLRVVADHVAALCAEA
jgi:DNA-binding transcriptional LysR family regulator